MDGEKLFAWEGGANEVAKLDADLTRLSKAEGYEPADVAKAALVEIKRNGGLRASSTAAGGEMGFVLLMLMNMQSTNEDHPGLIRDYIDVWDFDFDIEIEDGRLRVHTNAKFTTTGAA
jgi:hypothetical protein